MNQHAAPTPDDAPSRPTFVDQDPSENAQRAAPANDQTLGAIAFLKAILHDLSKSPLDAAPMADPTVSMQAEAAPDPRAAAPTAGQAVAQATLGDVIDRLDERAFGLMLLLLALPCCLPFVYLLPQIVALPMMALAAQLAAGRRHPWLPASLSQRRFGVAAFKSVLERSERYVGWFERVARPRFAVMTGRIGVRLVGAALVIPCASILVPLPATNTVPGVGVAIAALGLIERDGLLIALGLLIGLLWVAALLTFGLEAASLIKEFALARF